MFSAILVGGCLEEPLEEPIKVTNTIETRLEGDVFRGAIRRPEKRPGVFEAQLLHVLRKSEAE